MSMTSDPHSSHQNDYLDLSAWAWLWLPILYLALNFVIAGVDTALYNRTLGGGELGITELLTMLILILAVLIGLHSLWVLRKHRDWRLKLWILLGTLGCVYFGGEEASWGQHLIGWESSESWQQFNDQQETNLHNSDVYGPLLDQLPRNLLTLGILVGGIIAPLWRRVRKTRLDPAGIHYWIWPTVVCLPIAIAVVFISMPEKIVENLGIQSKPAFLRFPSGELKEFYIAFFLMTYLASFNLRLRQKLKNS